MKKIIQPIVISVLCLLVIFLLFKIEKIKNVSAGTLTREKGGSYKFTNPILDFELPQEISNSVFANGILKDFVENLKDDFGISHVSVYFRDLNNGPWVGIEEKEYFSPASMLKTPLMISLLKWSEYDKAVLDKVAVAEDRFFVNLMPQHNIVNTVIKGQSYTLLELATKMIQNSDNVAATMLYEYIPQNFIDDTFTNIGVPIVTEGEDTLIRVKDIASFYRVLFNASYLNRENSEKALSILSNSTYGNGLVAGIPKDISVAHKFGERFSSGVLFKSGLIPEGDVQLHDCGIIYYPGKPYILCILTRGDNFKEQENVISEISKFVYKRISK